MNFIDWIAAMQQWDQERVKQHKFPLMATLKYFYIAVIIFWVLYITYCCGYSSGRWAGWHDTSENNKSTNLGK